MKSGQRVRKGNFALAGHYMTSSGLLFGGINQLERKDQIYLTYKKEQAVYEVIETKVISEKAGSVIFDSQGDKLLTLITCDRAIRGTHRRFMVRATLVKKKEYEPNR